MTMPAEPGNQVTELPADAAQEVVAEAEPTIDYKAKFEATEAARAKIENDLKALKGQRMTEAQREQRMTDMADRLESLDKQQLVLIKALGDNTTEQLPAEVAKIQAESQQQRASRGFDAQFGSLWDDFQSAVKDPDGNVVLELKTAPEMEEARQIWTSAWNGLDEKRIGTLEALTLFARAIGEANRVTKVELRKRDQAEGKKAKEEAQASTKRKLDEAGVLDLDTGPAAGGGAGASLDALMKKDPYKMTPKELREYNTAIAAAQKRGQR